MFPHKKIAALAIVVLTSLVFTGCSKNGPEPTSEEINAAMRRQFEESMAGSLANFKQQAGEEYEKMTDEEKAEIEASLPRINSVTKKKCEAVPGTKGFHCEVEVDVALGGTSQKKTVVVLFTQENGVWKSN